MNNTKSTYHNKEYIYYLPDKMLVSLLRDYIEDHCKIDEKFLIISSPTSMLIAIHFENEMSQLKRIYITKNEQESEICKYFETVDRVTLI